MGRGFRIYPEEAHKLRATCVRGEIEHIRVCLLDGTVTRTYSQYDYAIGQLKVELEWLKIDKAGHLSRNAFGRNRIRSVTPNRYRCAFTESTDIKLNCPDVRV